MTGALKKSLAFLTALSVASQSFASLQKEEELLRTHGRSPNPQVQNAAATIGFNVVLGGYVPNAVAEQQKGLRKELDLVGQEKDQLRLRSEALELQRKSLDQQLQQRTQDLQQMTQARDQLNRQAQQVNQDLQQRTQDLQKRTRERDQFDQELQQMTQARDRLNQDLQRRTQDLQQRTRERDQFDQRLQQMTQARDQLNRQVQQVNQDLQQRTQERDQFDQQLQQMTQARDQLTQDLQQRTQERDQFDQQLQQMTQARDQLTQDLQQRTQERDQLTQDLQQMTQERDDLGNTLIEIREAVEEVADPRSLNFKPTHDQGVNDNLGKILKRFKDYADEMRKLSEENNDLLGREQHFRRLADKNEEASQKYFQILRALYDVIHDSKLGEDQKKGLLLRHLGINVGEIGDIKEHSGQLTPLLESWLESIREERAVVPAPVANPPLVQQVFVDRDVEKQVNQTVFKTPLKTKIVYGTVMAGLFLFIAWTYLGIFEDKVGLCMDQSGLNYTDCRDIYWGHLRNVFNGNM